MRDLSDSAHGGPWDWVSQYGIIAFACTVKISSRFIGPFEILERVGTVAYRLALLPSRSGVHEVFHFSMLRKYSPDPAHVVD